MRSLQPCRLAGARPASKCAPISPQLCTLTRSPPDGDDWLHEIKWDGYRMLCRIEDGRVVLSTRNGFDWTKRLGHLARAARALPCKNAILDGELVTLRPDGSSTFNGLQAALRGGKASTLIYYAFDLLHLNGYDLRRVVCLDRKQALAALLDGAEGPIRFVDYLQGHGPAFLEVCRQRGLEGVVSKRGCSLYAGRRTADWLETKCLREAEFVVGGFVPEGRTGVASLLLAGSTIRPAWSTPGPSASESGLPRRSWRKFSPF